MIKIEVTGNSIGEVADKLLAIGGSLRSAAPADPIKTIVVERVNPVMPEVAEMASVDPTPAPKSASAAETTESPPTTQEPSSTPAPAPSASEELNFETDVAPYVLQVVKEKGKPVAQEILSQFGVEKASNLDPAQWPELVKTLQGAL